MTDCLPYESDESHTVAGGHDGECDSYRDLAIRANTLVGNPARCPYRALGILV